MDKPKAIKNRSLGRLGIFLLVLLLISNVPGTGLAKDPTPSEVNSYYIKNYKFSQDWFTRAIPLWKEILAPFKGKPNINYLEIGVFEGMSAIWMLENILTAPTAKMTCIDIFQENLRERFLANLRIAGFYWKVNIIKGRSQVELRRLPLNSFDIIYIDGSHTANDVLADAVLSWELLKPGGIMIFDDYMWEDEQPVELRPHIAIDSFISAFKNDIEILNQDYQLILRRK